MSGRILAGFLAVLLLMVAGAAEPTRVVQAEEILKKIELGQPVRYDNAIIIGNLNIGGSKVETIYFGGDGIRQMRFYNGWNGNEKRVTSPIEITNSVILGATNLFRTFLLKNVDFSGNKFKGPVFLFRAHFNQTADFTVVQFNQTADFNGVQFNQAADFNGVQFNQTADFNGVQFNQAANFHGVQFNQDANFRDAQFNHMTDFRDVQFNQTAYFQDTKFIQTLDLSNTHFNQETHFDDAKFLDLSLDYGQFSKEAFFNGARINGTLSLYRTKYDTLNIRWSSIHDLAYDDTAYHLLIQNFNKLGFGDDSRECQYSYRCKHRDELFRQHRFDSWLFDLLAWATYGYGLRPVRPLGWAALLILMGGLFFFLTGSVARSKESTQPAEKSKADAAGAIQNKPDGNVSIWEALLLSATYFTSGASSIISATPTEFVPIGRGRYVVVILRLLGWIFFVLFLSSLTRTV